MSLPSLVLTLKDGSIRYVTPLKTAEAVGHEFHGNQWTGGVSTNDVGQIVQPNGTWRQGIKGEEPWEGESRLDDPSYVVPEIHHRVIRDGGVWGSSHGNSQMLTGASALQMGIDGYQHAGQVSLNGQQIVDRFLGAIAADTVGSEEVLHHSFENVRKTNFKVGDTLRLPLTATSGDLGGYGVRLDADNQHGQPTVFVFEKGTQMAAYGGMTLKDAKDLDYKSVSDAIKDRGYVWDEAIVAGGFEVTGVRTEYMGSQHSLLKVTSDGKRVDSSDVVQVYGKVVKLRQRETWDPEKGWIKRG